MITLDQTNTLCLAQTQNRVVCLLSVGIQALHSIIALGPTDKTVLVGNIHDIAPAAIGTCPVMSLELTVQCILYAYDFLSCLCCSPEFLFKTKYLQCMFHLFVFSVQSSGIFSSEQLLSEILSRFSNSLNLSSTHWAVSLASGSWSQHSVMVSHTSWIPWGKIQKLFSVQVNTNIIFFYILLKADL